MEGGASEVRVEEDAAGVDDRLEALLFQTAEGAGGEVRRVGRFAGLGPGS